MDFKELLAFITRCNNKKSVCLSVNPALCRASGKGLLDPGCRCDGSSEQSYAEPVCYLCSNTSDHAADLYLLQLSGSLKEQIHKVFGEVGKIALLVPQKAQALYHRFPLI